KIASCSMNAWSDFQIIASALLPNTFPGEKKTLTRLPILRLGISLKCATRLRRKHFAQKRSSITYSKPPCRELICRFIQWSRLRELLRRQRRNALAYKTCWFMEACSRSQRFWLG